MTPDLAGRLRSAFLAELSDQVRVMNEHLLALEQEPANAEHIRALFRIAHTLKGAARAAAIPMVEQVCHALESELLSVRDGGATVSAELLALMYTTADALQTAGVTLQAGQDLQGSELAQLHSQLGGGQQRPKGSLPIAVRPSTAPTAPAVALGTEVRFRLERLDQLQTSGNQLSLICARISELAHDITALQENVRLAMASAGGAAASETSRAMVKELGKISSEAARNSRALAAAADDTNTQIRALRMRPFSDACEALPRAVRDLSTSSGKSVRLVIEGGEVEADRAILGQLREAVLHLVRNAVDHGIEPAEVRLRAGKPKQATVTVSARVTGSGLTVAVRDDGGGLDVDAIRARLRAKGQAVPTADRDVARTLLGGGLSTRTQATAISGRGVGLDLVRDAVERIQGRIEIDWQVGGGTSVEIKCPPSLAGVRAVIVEAGSQVMAFPSAQVQRLVRVEVGEIQSLDGRQVITRPDSAPIPLVALATLLPPLVAGPVDNQVQAVILESSGRLLAVAVDQLLEEQELLLMPVTQHGARLPLVSGASLLPDGGVALVLDSMAVLEAGLSASATTLEVAAPQVAGPRTHHILLVDDSLTTRILEQGILETAGYQVSVAPDGSAAWRMLNEGGADLIVSDVEMPIMDGIALCEAVRASRQYAELPVVLVSALESEEDRKRGRLAGADAYLGKSGFDQARLLETIRQLLGS